MVTYDGEVGRYFLLVLEERRGLLVEMLQYSLDQFSKDETFLLLIHDADRELQDLAGNRGFVPTQERERDSYLEIHPDALGYRLPDSFSVRSMKDDYDLYRYGEVLWKGFNHEANGEGEYRPGDAKLGALHREMTRPNVDLDLKIAVVAPNGDFASYCGMWQDADSGYALVEPVATAPEYRRMGLGRAAVLEGVRRCGLRGARTAVVGSSQQFYYDIGFRPFGNATWWRPRA